MWHLRQMPRVTQTREAATEAACRVRIPIPGAPIIPSSSVLFQPPFQTGNIRLSGLRRMLYLIFIISYYLTIVNTFFLTFMLTILLILIYISDNNGNIFRGFRRSC